jgi:hypothetical protein
MEVGEENLNVMLAELLADKGLRALGEVILRKSRGRPEPDVLIDLNGVRIVIEGKKPGMWNELVRQCEERLDDNVCDLCVMVEYVNFEKLLNERLSLDQSYIKKFLLKGVYNAGFMSYIARVGLDRWLGLPVKYEKYENVGFDDLLAYLMTAYNKVVGEDVIGPVIAEMKKVLDEFAKNTAPMVNVERLKETLELREREDETDE